ncbi:Hint domain protein [compost metagenome]
MTGYGYILSLNGFSPTNFDFPVTFGYDASVYQVAVCFAEGTSIATATGQVTVEALTIGDKVLTASGAVRPVKWIGQMLARPSRHVRPGEVNPVRITAHAFGPNQPERDLRVSPGHAILVDGVLVPAGHLVNGATIVQEEVELVRYFHVELDSHDVLLAEGLPCESYLDDGNRASFANADDFTQMHGRLDPKSWDDACAPMVAAGPQLLEIQQRLHDRAEQLGWTRTEDAELTILADGTSFAPVYRAGNRYQFAVPAASELRLRSNNGVLSQVVPGLGDGRRLGVAVSRLLIDGESVALESDSFGAGFYPAERHDDHGWRWTNGDAALPGVDAPTMIEVELAMVVPSWTRPQLRIAA